MPNFKIIAWPIDEAEREYDPTWESAIEAETIGAAYAEGTRLFKEQCPELDHSTYQLHASTF